MPRSWRNDNYTDQRLTPRELEAGQWAGLSAVTLPNWVEDAAVIAGDLVAAELPDTAGIAASLTATAALAATDGIDTAQFSVTVSDTWISGTVSATEQTDSAAISAGLLFNGAFAAIEASQDAATASGTVGTAGTVVATEAADTALLGGSTASQGALAATEAPDIAAIASGTPETAVTLVLGGSRPDYRRDRAEAALAAVERPDRLEITGTVRSAGHLRAVEAPDGFRAQGLDLVAYDNDFLLAA